MDTLMFIFKHHPHLILLIYIDNIILTGSSPELMSKLTVCLSSEFLVKDSVDLHYFLGVHAVWTPSGLFVSQSKYIGDMLRKFHLHTFKFVRMLNYILSMFLPYIL